MSTDNLLKMTSDDNIRKKRPYHGWQRHEIKQLASECQTESNRTLARRYNVTNSAIRSLLCRHGITRQGLRRRGPNGKFTPPVCPGTKQSITDEFREAERRYGQAAYHFLSEVKTLIEDTQIEEARLQLEEKCPLPVYELIIIKTDPPNKRWDCLAALSRWVLRRLEVNPNNTIEANLIRMEKTMNEKCNFC